MSDIDISASTEKRDGASQPTETRVGVWSEIGKLRRVLVCAPGLAHQRLTPENSGELLFDDVIWLAQARRDHYDFVAKMEDRDVEVLDLQECLEEVVADDKARAWLLDRKITDNIVGPGVRQELRAWLDQLSAAELANYLIGGVAYHEIPKDFAGGFITSFGEMNPAGFLIKPLPNTQFMRDNSSWIFHGVTLNPMYWPARSQETLLTTAVYRFHSAFAGEKYNVWFGDIDSRPHDYGAATLEGGDVMPIGKGIVVMGMGERTSEQAISQVAKTLFDAGAAERVIVAGLPRTRTVMHLDTIFTFCNHDVLTAYAPIVDGIVPFSLRPDDTSPSGLDIRRERRVWPRRSAPQWVSSSRSSPPPAMSTVSGVSSGTTPTTSSRWNPAW